MRSGWLHIGVALLAFTGCERSGSDCSTVPAAPSAQASEVWHVGGIDDASGVVFEAYPATATLDLESRVAVVEPSAPRVILLEPDGRFAKDLGRPGSGPGEWTRPERIGIHSDSLLWVVDPNSDRVTWLRTSGDLIGTSRHGREMVPSTPWSLQLGWILEGGWILAEARYALDLGAVDALEPMPLAVWDPMGEQHIVDWIERPAPLFLRIPTPSGFPITTVQYVEGNPVVGAPQGGEWFFVLERGPAEAECGTFVIRRFTPWGEEVGTLVIPYQSVAVDGEVMARLEDRAAAHVGRIPEHLGRVTAADILTAAWIPERLPPVTLALADPEGFWLRREQVRPGRWERYSLDGTLEVVLDLPEDFHGLAARRSVIVGRRVDTLGVPSLLRYDVTF